MDRRLDGGPSSLSPVLIDHRPVFTHLLVSPRLPRVQYLGSSDDTER